MTPDQRCDSAVSASSTLSRAPGATKARLATCRFKKIPGRQVEDLPSSMMVERVADHPRGKSDPVSNDPGSVDAEDDALGAGDPPIVRGDAAPPLHATNDAARERLTSAFALSRREARCRQGTLSTRLTLQIGRSRTNQSTLLRQTKGADTPHPLVATAERVNRYRSRLRLT